MVNNWYVITCLSGQELEVTKEFVMLAPSHTQAMLDIYSLYGGGVNAPYCPVQWRQIESGRFDDWIELSRQLDKPDLEPYEEVGVNKLLSWIEDIVGEAVTDKWIDWYYRTNTVNNR